MSRSGLLLDVALLLRRLHIEASPFSGQPFLYSRLHLIFLLLAKFPENPFYDDHLPVLSKHLER